MAAPYCSYRTLISCHPLQSLMNHHLLCSNESSAATIFSPSPLEMSSDSDSDERFSDESEESEEEIVDLTLPTPLPKKKQLISDFFKPTRDCLVLVVCLIIYSITTRDQHPFLNYLLVRPHHCHPAPKNHLPKHPLTGRRKVQEPEVW